MDKNSVKEYLFSIGCVEQLVLVIKGEDVTLLKKGEDIYSLYDDVMLIRYGLNSPIIDYCKYNSLVVEDGKLFILKKERVV